MIVVPHEGLRALLSMIVKDTIASTLKFKQRFYQNTVTLNLNTVLADLSECTFAGYSPVDLIRANWSTPSDTSIFAQSLYGTLPITMFTTSGTQDVHGSYVTDEGNTVILWAEAYPVPITVSTTVPAIVFPMLLLRGP